MHEPATSPALVGLLASLALSLWPAPKLAAQAPVVTAIDADLEEGPLRALVLSVEPHADVYLNGEAYESLSRGYGASVALAGYFDGRYAIRGRVAATRHSEASAFDDEMTTTLDAWLEMRWTWLVAGLGLELGPTAGYERLARPLFEEPTHGFLFGLGAGVTRPIRGALDLVLGADVTWSSFNRPSFVMQAPPGYDDDASGTRASLRLGLGYRWSR